VIQELGGDNLLGYWPMEETSGNILYEKNSILNGIYSGSLGGIGVEGRVGLARQFNGIDDLMNMTETYSRPVTEMTISVWVKLDDVVSTFQMIADFNWNNGSPNGYMLKVENQKISIWAGDGSPLNFSYTNDFLTSGSWLHIVSTYNNGAVNVYKNGSAVSMGDATCSSTIAYQFSNLMIGGTDPSYFKGGMDDLRIFDRALTISEIEQLYRFGANSK
jgi:hypothetical protein